MNYQNIYSELIKKYFGRYPAKKDSMSKKEIAKVESNLGVNIPTSLKEFYLIAGNLTALNHLYNYLYAPGELTIDKDYLVFQDENQSVVSWGFLIEDLTQENPIVWQRNNTPPVEWYSEEITFPEFMESMFEWYIEAQLIENKQ